MSVKATVTLPDAIYDYLRRAAEKLHRPVDDVLSEAVIAVAPVLENGDKQMCSAFAQLAYLNDAALFQAARSTMTIGQRERLEELNDKQQRELLFEEEHAEAEALTQLYLDTILIRAQAAGLLKFRGYDISDPEQFQPLE